MDNELQFDDAQGSIGTSACSGCKSALSGAYFQANGKVLCERCAEGVRKFFHSSEGGFGRFLKATAFGLAGGLVGGAVYTGVLALTQINAALITILIGWLAGKAVRAGSGGRGGVGYQILAVGITYWIIGLSFMMTAVLSAHGKHHSFGVAIFACGIGAFVAPVMEATHSILGGVITFFGLMQAWKWNAPVRVNITGPHTLGAFKPSNVDPIDPMVGPTPSAPPPLPAASPETPAPVCLSPALPN